MIGALYDSLVLWAGSHWYLARHVPSNVYWSAYWRKNGARQ